MHAAYILGLVHGHLHSHGTAGVGEEEPMEEVAFVADRRDLEGDKNHENSCFHAWVDVGNGSRPDRSDVVGQPSSNPWEGLMRSHCDCWTRHDLKNDKIEE